MSFCVIIPSKTASNLIPCVEAVRKHESNAEIIVVDDGLETEASGLGIKSRFWGPIRFVLGAKPFIFARNVNLGIQEAWRCEAVEVEPKNGYHCYEPGPLPDGFVILNDDALLQTPGGFTRLAQFAAEHPEVGCVAPATNVTGQPLQWPARRTPGGWRYVDTVPYVCVYIPRRTIERVGLLDERYCVDYGVEDRDHTEAMTRAGLKVAVLYDVFVDHGSLKSSFRGDPKTPKSFAKNYELFKQKWGVA